MVSDPSLRSGWSMRALCSCQPYLLSRIKLQLWLVLLKIHNFQFNTLSTVFLTTKIHHTFRKNDLKKGSFISVTLFQRIWNDLTAQRAMMKATRSRKIQMSFTNPLCSHMNLCIWRWYMFTDSIDRVRTTLLFTFWIKKSRSHWLCKFSPTHWRVNVVSFMI